jgi:hypothetical protein
MKNLGALPLPVIHTLFIRIPSLLKAILISHSSSSQTEHMVELTARFLLAQKIVLADELLIDN